MLSVSPAHAPGGRHGRGRRCSAGFPGAIGVRRRAPAEGIEVTTSGDSLVRAALSMAAIRCRGAVEIRGAVKTLLASPRQVGHGRVGPAVPMGRLTSNGPSVSQRYSYVDTTRLLCRAPDELRPLVGRECHRVSLRAGAGDCWVGRPADSHGLSRTPSHPLLML